MASRQGTPNRDTAPGVSPVLSPRGGGRPCRERDSSPGCGRSGTPGTVTPRVCRGPPGAGWAGAAGAELRTGTARPHRRLHPHPGERAPSASRTPHPSRQEPLASGTPHRSPQEALASGTPIPRLRNLLPQEPLISLLRNTPSLASGTPHLGSPSGKARLVPGEWEGVAVPSRLCRSVISQMQQGHVSPGRRER